MRFITYVSEIYDNIKSGKGEMQIYYCKVIILHEVA